MKETIDYIEDKNILIRDDWFYHAMPFSKKNYTSALNNGILSPYLLSCHNSSYRYVFVSRKNQNSKHSAFENYSIYPNFIINNNIHGIKATDSFIKKLFYGGYHGLRFTSLYDDEYQVYKKIGPEQIIGFLFNLEKLTNKYDKKYYFKMLCDLVVLLNELDLSLPIVDYYTSKEINKPKVLSLIK